MAEPTLHTKLLAAIMMQHYDGDPVHIDNAFKKMNELAKKMQAGTIPSKPAPAPTPTPTPPPSPTSTFAVTRPFWLGGWSDPVETFVRSRIAENSGKTAIFILYNIPGRDNGNYSAGGLSGPTAYKAWIDQIATGIGSSPTICVIEPDSLGLLPGMTDPAKKVERYDMLRYAAAKLGSLSNTKVYQDASMWIGAGDMANMLKQIPGIDGFSCNVSGNDPTDQVAEYCEEVSRLSGGLHYVIDTSRNGISPRPHPGMWCNVTDTKVGVAPTNVTASAYCDAYLWLKVPGESDGLQINGDGSGPNRTDIPGAGGWWQEFADAIYSGNWAAFKTKYGV